MTVLSGAGISAESGVPTFRDAETGLWAKVDPYEISSAEGWRDHPDRVWAWYLWRHYMMGSVQPNNGHLAVAAWQDYADVHVVTQNVDNLHERAGSKRVYHLHGSLFEFRCDRCQCEYRGELPAMPEAVASVDPPRCACGGLIRPNVVWFGEPLPDDILDEVLTVTAGQRDPRWWAGDSQQGGTQLTDEAVDWIEETANGE